MFSCFARELKRVSARTGDELIASMKRSFNGLRVEWLDTVVDFWSVISTRCIRYQLSKSYSFQIRKNTKGQVVHRTKDAMHGEVWFPIGFSADDLQFAQPLLLNRTEAFQGPFRCEI